MEWILMLRMLTIPLCFLEALFQFCLEQATQAVLSCSHTHFVFFLKWTCFLFLSTILCCGFVLSLYHWNAFSLWQYFFGSLHWDCSGIFVVTICSGNYFEKIEGDMKPVTKRSRCFILEVLWLCLKLSLAGTWCSSNKQVLRQLSHVAELWMK